MLNDSADNNLWKQIDQVSGQLITLVDFQVEQVSSGKVEMIDRQVWQDITGLENKRLHLIKQFQNNNTSLSLQALTEKLQLLLQQTNTVSKKILYLKNNLRNGFLLYSNKKHAASVYQGVQTSPRY